MRHRLKGSKLGRTASHRKATLRSLSIALLTHHRIVTTLVKAKELRRHVEPVINRAKEDTTHNRREVFSFIQDNSTVTKLFDEIGPKVTERQGGYTRVVKLGTRRGDSAEMAVIELVDYNDSGSEAGAKKKKRTRRAGKAAKLSETKADGKVTKDTSAPTVATEEHIPVESAEVTDEVAPEEIAPDGTTSDNEESVEPKKD